MEMRIPGAAGCCKGVEDVRKQEFAKSYSRELRLLFDEVAGNHVEVLQGVHHVEIPPSSKRVAAVGSDNVSEPACDGVSVDAERRHQPVREGAQGYKPI